MTRYLLLFSRPLEWSNVTERMRYLFKSPTVTTVTTTKVPGVVNQDLIVSEEDGVSNQAILEVQKEHNAERCVINAIW